MNPSLQPPSTSAQTPAAGRQRNFRHRLLKGISVLRNQGPSTFVRESVYNIYYRRHQRRHSQRASDSSSPKTLVELWGAGFELPPESDGIAEELRLYGVHEPLATSAYQALLLPDDHIVDIGANIGYYLVAAARVVGGRGRFLAFEPVPRNFAILQRNVSRAGLRHCTVEPWAIGAANETAVFFESNVSNLGGLIPHRNQEVKQEIAVEVRRLDDIVLGFEGFHPTVVRMDVEGAEVLVLAGAENVLARYMPMLFIEFHTFAIGMDRIKKTLDHLRVLGYKRGVLIDRLWDQPWIAPWARARRCWHDSMDNLLDRFSARSAHFPVFTLIVQRPSC